MRRTYYIDAINRTVNFSFSFDEAISKRIKDIHRNVRWNTEMKMWIVPVDMYSKNLISELIADFSFIRHEPVTEDVKVDYSRSKVDYAYLRGLCDAKDFAYTPRDYQIEALGYAREKGSFINGDDVGLGKTFESIMHAETSNSFPCLVVVPASVKYNWKEKWEEITKSKRSISVIESKETKSRKNNWGADVVIINYDILAKKQGKGVTVKFSELESTPWKMCIIDEGHFLKNKSSQRSKAMKKILKTVPSTQILTGTATSARPIELWNLLKLIDKDTEIADDWFQFIKRYCGGYKGRFGWVTNGATNTLELNEKLRNTCYIRREKRDVLEELPDVTKQVVKVPITNIKEIKQATYDLIEYVKNTKGQESAEKAMEAEHLVALNVMRKLSIQGKLKAIEKYLKDWKESGVKLVVFGIHSEPLKYFAEKFNCPIIAGGLSAKKKQETVKSWIESDDIFLFANIESCGTGVDGLQKVCSNMIIIELPWRPSDLTQVIGRLDRSGQKSATTVTYLLSEETVDEQMWKMLCEKEFVAESVNKGIDINRNKSGMKEVIRKIMKKELS